MEDVQHFLLHDWLKLVVPLGVFTAVLLIGLAMKRLIFGALRRWGARSESRLPAILPQALGGPFMIWVLLLGIHLALQFSAMPDRLLALAAKGLLILWVISFTILAARFAGTLVRLYGSGIPGALQVTTLTQNLAQLTVVILGSLVLLRLLGISIAPLLTALGVGGLAVALALQDTLSNLFAGFYVTVAGQIRLGDYIRLNTGEEGYVTDITWRSTTIRALANNWIIIPNAKLAQAIVTNFDLPEKRMAVTIRITVGYDVDPDRVERLLMNEVQGAAADTPGLLALPVPSVRLIPGFGESGLDFTLSCHVAEFADQFRVQHELRKRILRRFRTEGIEISPGKTVYLQKTD